MRLLLFGLVVAVLVGGWALMRRTDEAGPEAPRTRAEHPRPARVRPAARPRPPLRRPACPENLPRCRSVRDRVVYVESVDPDGDGDLHVVLAGGGVTALGFTSVDVSAALRPRRDPRLGDQASGAGQVQRGSFGQSQIHAVEFHVRRR